MLASPLAGPAPAGSLLQRSSLRRQRASERPFIVQFRVHIRGGGDNTALARKLTRQINTPYAPAAMLLPLSMARMEGEEFPPVKMPTSPPRHAMRLWRPAQGRQA